MNLSKNIANRRKQLNMTQEKLAEQANITVNYLSKLERNRANDVKLSTLLKLSKSLSLSLDLLVNGTEKEITTTSGPYQEQLFSLINQYNTNQAETISKNIIALLKVNKPLSLKPHGSKLCLRSLALLKPSLSVAKKFQERHSQ